MADNIIVLDHIFNLTKKSNLIGRLYYDLTLFFDNFGVAYFFGPPCIIKLFCGFYRPIQMFWLGAARQFYECRHDKDAEIDMPNRGGTSDVNKLPQLFCWATGLRKI